MGMVDRGIRRFGLFAMAMVLSAVSVLTLQPAAPASAAATCTSNCAVWTGDAGDNKFSTAGNWQGSTVPTTGSTLVFNKPGTDDTLQNDLSNVKFAGLVTTTNATTAEDLIMVDTLAFQGGATWHPNINLNVYPVSVTVDGNFTIESGYIFYADLTTSGIVTVKSGNHLNAGLSSYGGLVLENDTTACFEHNRTTVTVSYPVTLGGGDSNAPSPTISTYHVCGAGGGPGGGMVAGGKLVLNTVILQGDASVWVAHPDTVDVKTWTLNGHTLSLRSDADGTLITPDGTQAPQEKTTNLNGDMPNEVVYVLNKETALLNGTRGIVDVGQGGILKGNGTVSALSVSGTVAPGNSPGKITVVNDFRLYGTYQAELLNKNSYDQIVAGGVSLQGTLSLAFLPGGSVTQGDTFTIISNTGSDPVDGTFTGLAQGAQITVGGATFSIDYQGDDGNDVVLTAINTANAPGAPNTGLFAPTIANPVVIALLGLGAAGVLLYVRKKSRQ